MIGFLLRWLINTAALILVVKLVPGIVADSTEAILLAALLLGFFNTVLRPLIILFALPLYIFSLGLFTLVVNGFMLLLVAKIVEGFFVRDFWSAFWGALFFSVINFSLSLLIDPKGTMNIRVAKTYSQRRPSDGQRRKDRIIDVEGRSKDDDQ